MPQTNVARRVGDSLLFLCPGCQTRHQCPVSGGGAVWTWNGSLERPTLSPSVLVRTGHYIPTLQKGQPNADKCWCTWNAQHPEEPAPFTCGLCHSFVTDGRIQFLSDCTHALAGRTVDLPPFTDA